MQQGVSTDVRHLLDKYLIASLYGNCAGILPSAFLRSCTSTLQRRDIAAFVPALFFIISLLFFIIHLTFAPIDGACCFSNASSLNLRISWISSSAYKLVYFSGSHFHNRNNKDNIVALDIVQSNPDYSLCRCRWPK
jgi:hypothetical protein